jgi:hypothetical protein
VSSETLRKMNATSTLIIGIITSSTSSSHNDFSVQPNLVGPGGRFNKLQPRLLPEE